jgi:hypothetical protein
VAPTGEEILRLVFTAALQRLTADPTPTSENSQKLFLTIPEAAAVSGLSQAFLRRKCQDGWTGAIKDGGGPEHSAWAGRGKFGGGIWRRYEEARLVTFTTGKPSMEPQVAVPIAKGGGRIVFEIEPGRWVSRQRAWQLPQVLHRGPARPTGRPRKDLEAR